MLYVSNDVVQPQNGPLGVRTMSDIIWGNVPKIPTKKGFNRNFQAKLSKSKNCNISETIHPISPKLDDETHTINDTSWVVHH